MMPMAYFLRMGFSQGYFMKSIIEQASSIMKAIEKAWNQAEQPKEFSIKIFEKEERNFFGMTTKPAKIGIFFGDKPMIHEKPAPKPRPEIKECRPAAPHQKTLNPAASAPKNVNIQNKPSDLGKTVQDRQPDNSVKADTTVPTEKQTEKSESKSNDHQKPAAHTPQRPAQPQHEAQINRATAQVKQTQPRPQQTASVNDQGNNTEKKQPATPAAKEEKPRRIPATWNETMVTSAHNWLKRTLDLMNMGSHQFNSEIAGKNLKLTFHAPLIIDIAHEKQLFRSFAHLIMSSLRNQYKQEIKDLKVILIRPE